MRLIDADKLIKQLDDDINITSEFVKKSIKYDDYRDFDKSFAILYMLKSYRAIVEDMKTTFDVEKVVEQLEEQISKHDLLFNKYVKDKDKSDSWSISELNKIRGLLEAIDIVKAR